MCIQMGNYFERGKVKVTTLKFSPELQDNLWFKTKKKEKIPREF